MKTKFTKPVLLSFIFVAIILGGCRRNEEEEEIPVTSDDAADVITYALQSSSGGYANQCSETAEYLSSEGLRSTQSLQCGVLFDSTVSFSYNGNNLTANYSLQWELLLNCDSMNLPQSLSFTSPYSGNYDGPLMSSSNSGNLNWTVTGLASGNSVPYTFSGNFTRNGNHTSKVRNQTSFSSDLQITVMGVAVDKVTQQITGGTANASLTCQSSTGNNYSFSGTIVFNGNGSATLTIGSNTYSIDLY